MESHVYTANNAISSSKMHNSSRTRYALCCARCMQHRSNSMASIKPSIYFSLSNTSSEVSNLICYLNRPTQLLLEDDPNFIPELAWGIDFDPFNDILGFTSGEGSSDRSSLLSPHAAVSSALGSEHQLEPNMDIVIPRSSSAGGGGFGLGLGGVSLGGSDHNRGYSRSLFGANEEGLLPDIDLGLDFEVEGNFVDDAGVPGGGRAASIHTPAPVLRDGVFPDSNVDRDVVMYDDEPLPVYQDDIDMQDAEPFAPRTAVQADPNDLASAQADQAQSQTSSTTASAPAVRTRVPKPLPQDQQLELHNADLQTWDREYLATQSRALQQKLANKTLTLARKNADFWILQNGIGGLGMAYQGLEAQYIPEPLRMFSGNALLQALTGIQLSIAGTKHPRAIDADEEDDQRHVRTRSNSHEVGRAADSNEGFETGFVDDTIVDTIEQGRDAPTPLPDVHSSAHALPWNHAAATSRGSSHTAFVPPYPLFAPGAGGPSSSIAGGGGGISIRGRRTVSASPLVGRGIAAPTALDDEDMLHSDTHFAAAFPAASASAEPDATAPQHPSFDLFGPAALVSTQLASTTPFLSATLTTESANFLAFVKAAIYEAKAAKETTIEAIASVLDVEQEEQDEDDTVEFEMLLKPEENSRVVAAQGFLHVLTLVTKGLLSAEQGSAFGGIELRVL